MLYISPVRRKADIFLTTDDRLLRKTRRHRKVLGVKVMNPLRWLIEVTEYENAADDALRD